MAKILKYVFLQGTQFSFLLKFYNVGVSGVLEPKNKEKLNIILLTLETKQ